MIKLIKLLKENLNLKAGRTYPEIELIPFNELQKEWAGDGFHIIDKKTSDKIGAVVIRTIDGVNNVIHTIFIDPKFRGKSFAVPTYVELAKTLGNICSGEFREDGTPTSFVSKEANNVWDRLNEIFKIEKIPIQGNKFRYCLKKENL
jgi:hypothetical protein